MNHTRASLSACQPVIQNRRSRFSSALRLAITASAFGLVTLISAMSARAAELTWVADSGTFNVNGNWSGGVAPVDGDKTVFTNEENFAVSLSGDTVLQAATTISNHTGAVTLNNNGFTWNTTNSFRLGIMDSTSTVYLASGVLAVSDPVGATAS